MRLAAGFYETDAARARARRLKRYALARHSLGRVFLFVAVAAVGMFFLIPLLWMISTSVKPHDQVWLIPPSWIPRKFMWENFGEPWSILPFPRFYLNTIIVSVLSVIGMVISSSMVAFAFARLRFRGRGFLFLILLSTLMLPTHITLIPQYVLFNWFGWINTLQPLWVPTFFSGPFNTFLLRQYMLTISPEMDEAARVDGAGYFAIYRRIILPLSRPVLGVVAINTFTFHWNDFFGPLIYLTEQNNFTIALGLRVLQGDYFQEFPVQHIMSMTLISILPVMILFFIAQRYFIQGIVITGVKG